MKNESYLIGIGNGNSTLFIGEPIRDGKKWCGPDGRGGVDSFNSRITEVLVGRELLKHQIVKLEVSE